MPQQQAEYMTCTPLRINAKFLLHRGRRPYMAAFIGLVPRNNSSGGKQRLGPISKQGDRYLRRILVVGAHSILKQARTRPDKHPWLARLMARKPGKLAAVALANKTARIAWAVLARGETYRAPTAPAAAG